MNNSVQEGKTFTKLVGLSGLEGVDIFENCQFSGCDFSGQHLAGLSFSQCSFDCCNLSNAHIDGTVFKDLRFSDCKLLGLAFSKCRDFFVSLRFENCLLHFTSFSGLKLRQTVFVNCELRDASFFKTDLSGSVFDRCDLNRALFGRTNLEKVDFTSSYNYIIEPEENRIRKAKFSAFGLPGLLQKYDIEIV